MLGVKRIRNTLLGSGLVTCLIVFYTLGLATHNISTYKDSQAILKRKVFPSPGSSNDRITEQLRYQPNSRKIKTILLLDEHKMWSVPPGKAVFSQKKCPIDSCSISYNPNTISKADIVITRGADVFDPPKLRPDQLWLVYQLESPLSRPFLHSGANWTATFRRDSTLVTPYGKWISHAQDGLEEMEKEEAEEEEDYVGEREDRVAWLVSNCNANNARLEYARALSNFFPVDIMGQCGDRTNKCPRGKQQDECWRKIARKYKYYLSFENSNCVDYISEKFWQPLKYRVLPVVMGARLEDYQAVAPPNSFLHVDNFPGPRSLAEHLTFLSENPSEYNKHFRWVRQGRFADTKFFCRVCGLLHHPKPVSRFHSDIEEWWSPAQTCTNSSWSNSWSADSL